MYQIGRGAKLATIPLSIATICYVWTALALVYQGNPALAFTYGAYAAANVGLMLVANGATG
jgi:hypothetical protein